MKKEVIIFLFLVITFSTFISASSVGLIENQAWQSNLTSSSYKALGATVLGDIDNDGDLDMIAIGCASPTPTTACTTSEITRVYINNGTTFTENSTWQSNLSNIDAGSLALGDVDNDGDLDLVLASVESPTGGTKIYINNGTTFTENSTWQSNLMNPTAGADSNSVALGDIDNDGDLDLIFSDMGIASRTIWINNGTSFVNDSAWFLEDVSTGKISTGLADWDNDGDLDLTIFGSSSAKTYINNGTSLVNVPSYGATSGDEASVALGDINNDGFIDHVTSRASSIVIGINNGSEFAGNDL